MQAGVVPEKELRVLHLDPQATGSGSDTLAKLELPRTQNPLLVTQATPPNNVILYGPMGATFFKPSHHPYCGHS